MSASGTPSAGLDDDGTALALGRLFRARIDRYDNLDRRSSAMAEGPEKAAACEASQSALDTALRIWSRVTERKAESLGDAAVLAAYAMHRADALLGSDLFLAYRNGTLERDLAEIRRAAAGIVTVTVTAAGIDLSAIAWPDTARMVRQTLTARA